MKRIRFTKAIGFRSNLPGHCIPDHLGYLLLHPQHPGREFVIARTTKVKQGFAFEGDMWRLYDRATGLPLSSQYVARLRDAEPQFIAELHLQTPAQVVADLEARQVRRATKILQLDT